MNITPGKDQFINESIENIEYHSHFPYASSKLQNSEEIIITVQHQDIYTLPSKSYLLLEGKFVDSITNGPVSEKHNLINNFAAYLFDEIRYEMNGVEIEKIKNPGITSTLKGISTFGRDMVEIENYGWNLRPSSSSPSFLSPTGDFSLCIPLSCFLGTAESYKKLVVNVKQELILIRSRKDDNCYYVNASEGENVVAAKIVVNKLVWRLPYVSLAHREKLTLLKLIEAGASLNMAFRTWELYEYPLLPRSRSQVWTVKTSTLLEKPRYIILAFQTNRKENITSDSSKFDHCNLRNAKLFLNSKMYPYDDMNIDFGKNQVSVIYHMLTDFMKSYTGDMNRSPYATISEFRSETPIITIDCSKQQQSLKTGSIDIRLEFEAASSFPDMTTAYCLVFHDRSVEYNPLTGVVRRLI